jgi:hypothetical protein
MIASPAPAIRAGKKEFVMSPGWWLHVTTAVSASRTAVFTSPNRAFRTPGRAYGATFSPTRQRFSATANPENGHEISLGDNELATVTVDADGNTVISIENKPAENGGGNGGNGNGPLVAPVQESRTLSRRLQTKMSWERDPAIGGIVFRLDAGETLDVDGDTLMAVVTAPGPRRATAVTIASKRQ